MAENKPNDVVSGNGRRLIANSIPSLREAIPSKSNFRPRSAADILSQEPEAITWIWEPFIPEGSLALLAAFMKVGKSTFVYALATAIAQGRPFLAYSTKRVPVLILAVEEHARDVANRLRKFGMRPEDPIYVHTGSLWNSAPTVAKVRAFVADKGAGFVILDTLSRYWTVADENANALVVQQVSPLLDLARDTGAAVLLVHHESKGGGEYGRGIRGGSSLFGLVDQALILERRPGGHDTLRALNTFGRYSETPATLVIDFDGNEYHCLGTPEEAGQAGTQRAVLAVLTDTPDTPESIAATAGRQVPPTRTALQALHSRGEIGRSGKGVKGDPYRYHCAPTDSIPSESPPLGVATNQGWTLEERAILSTPLDPTLVEGIRRDLRAAQAQARRRARA